jgi:hypothetical protein
MHKLLLLWCLNGCYCNDKNPNSFRMNTLSLALAYLTLMKIVCQSYLKVSFLVGFYSRHSINIHISVILLDITVPRDLKSQITK